MYSLMNSNYQEEYRDLDVLSNIQLTRLVNELSVEWFDKRVEHSVSFNNRLSTTAGRVVGKWSDGVVDKVAIQFNAKYLKEYGMEELIRVIKHELCHYHLLLSGKGYKHADKDFQDECRRIGAPLGGCAKIMTHLGNWKYKYECIRCGNALYRSKILDLTRVSCKCNSTLLLTEYRGKDRDVESVLFGSQRVQQRDDERVREYIDNLLIDIERANDRDMCPEVKMLIEAVKIARDVDRVVIEID